MPIQPFAINKENERVQHKMYRMFLHKLNTLHAFYNKESHDPNFVHCRNCKLSVFLLFAIYKCNLAIVLDVQKLAHLLHTFHE